MTKFLIGMVTGLILAGLVAVILVVSLVRFGSEKKAVIASNSALMLRLEGNIPERAPVEFPIPFFDQQSPLTVREVSDLLRKAAADSRIKAVIFEPKGVQAGWAKLEELRSALTTFRKSGKPLVAYLKSPGTREYYLASAADRIHMGPEDYLDVKGLRAEMMYFRGSLDKLGVRIEIEHAGKYKNFGDMFERTSMSPETKEVMDSILDDLYGRLVSTLAEARKKTPDEMRAAIDEGPFLPKA
ncbi:MAG: S49 family peptidase, partial [Bryobacteraceae bacterium]